MVLGIAHGCGEPLRACDRRMTWEVKFLIQLWVDKQLTSRVHKFRFFEM